MISLNPFKKKNKEGFSLDNQQLQSLSDVGGNAQPSQDNTPPEPSLASQSQAGAPQGTQSQNMVGQSPEMGPSQEGNQSPGTGPLPSNQNAQQQGDFSNPFAQSQNPSSMQPQDLSASSDPAAQAQPAGSQEGQGQSSKDSQIHNDYSKAKLESIDSKVALLEAKISSLEQKVDALVSMVSAEVSEETKSNLKLNSMLDSAKQKSNK